MEESWYVVFPPTAFVVGGTVEEVIYGEIIDIFVSVDSSVYVKCVVDEMTVDKVDVLAVDVFVDGSTV